jgi:predicted DCC family thiol-disulfide oxidoreductase YuxK
MPATTELIYDGDCRFCTRCVRIIAAWDRAGAIRLVPFQAPGAMATHPDLTLEEAREAMQFYDARGKRWAGAEAFREAARLLPAGGPLAFVLGLPGIRQLAGAVYRLIARNRYRLGCDSQSCTRP